MDETAAAAGSSRTIDTDSQIILASRLRPDILVSDQNSEPETDANQTYTQRSSVATALYDAEDSRSSFSQVGRNAGTCARESKPASEAGEEPPAKVRRLSGDDIDCETCPICLDSWSNSGDHRLVALKCGHLFGARCVERWLEAQPVEHRACPTCKTENTMRDIRPIYGIRLVAADTSQIVTLQKQIDTLQAEKNRVELDLELFRAQIGIVDVSWNFSSLVQQLKRLMESQENGNSWSFALEKNLKVHRDGGCRVLTYSCRSGELYVSQKNINCLFPGYGVRKVSCVDYKLGQFVNLHRKPIRDMKYSQPRDLLLSVGLDRSARVVERDTPIMTVQCETPLWSCCWDYLRNNEFYVGGAGGVILRYDIRKTSAYLQTLQSPAPRGLSPVVSLCSTKYGLLSCQLNTCLLWVANQRQWTPRSMPGVGPFMSLCYDNESNRALISCRPNSSGERSKLALCKLKARVERDSIVDTNINTNRPNWPLNVIVNREQTFSGSTRSTLTSRAAWVKVPGAVWVAAYSESDSTLYLHGVDEARTMSLSAAEPALDLCSVKINGATLLAALSESRLRMYKAVQTRSTS